MKDIILLLALIALGISILSGCTKPQPSGDWLYRIPQYTDKNW